MPRNGWKNAIYETITAHHDPFLWPLLNHLQLCPTPPLKRSTLFLAISNVHHLLGMRSKSSSSFHKKTLRHVIHWNGGRAVLHSSLTCQNMQEIYLVHQVCEHTCLYKYIQLIAYSRVCCCCWVYILWRKGHNLSMMLSSAAWDNLHTYACEAMPQACLQCHLWSYWWLELYISI